MVLHPERRKVVQQLRQMAGRLGVPRVSDTASKEAVSTMIVAMLAAPQLSDADRTSLLFTKAAYDATWQPQVQPPEERIY